MAITRITAQWNGFRGAPGYSNFFFGGAPGLEDEVFTLGETVRSFFAAFNSRLPSGLSITIQPAADVLDEATGSITEQIDMEPFEPVLGGSQSSYSAASGAVVNWNTTAYRNGRRVRGRTFIVPLTTNSYDAQGDLAELALNDLRAGAAVMTSGMSVLPFVVWARPNASGAGTAHPVTSANVPDMGAILRSRRD